MENRKRIGLYGSGDVPRSGRLMSRSVGPKSKGLRDLQDLPRIKRVRPTRFSRSVVAASAVVAVPVAVVLAIVTAIVLSTSMVPEEILNTTEEPPPTGYSIYGFTLDNTGVPVPNTPINITNLATGQWIVSASDPDFGAYIVDVKPISGGNAPTSGTVFRLVATFGVETGVNETATPDPVGGGFWMNVTQGVIIPEFGQLVLPIVGVLGIFAMVAVASRSKKS